jgi:hypothetical protein
MAKKTKMSDKFCDETAKELVNTTRSNPTVSDCNKDRTQMGVIL